MTVAVCIVGFRNAEDIAHCLTALGRSTYADYEVVICENGGTAAFSELVDILPNALPGGQPVQTILAAGNLGFAGGVNICMHARPLASAWWILNPDAQPDPDALAELVTRLAEGDADAVAGTLYLPGQIVQAHGGHWRRWLGRPLSMGRNDPLGEAPPRDAIEPRLSYLLGASMLIGPRFVERAGLMREDYFLYGEEIEWCLRALARGARLGFAPAARVLHTQGSTTGSADDIRNRPRLPIYLDERNKLNIVRDVDPWRLPVAIPATLVLLTARFARRGAWPQWRWALSGWWSGVLGRRGVPAWLSQD
jgi:GT2 family glycosyltransferase